MQDLLLQRLQNWYQINCNGDWEHSYGVLIGTIDNPGWTIKIDLSETSLDNLQFERNIDNGRFDWMFIKTNDNIFEATCDPTKLNEVLRIFLDEIIPHYSDSDFLYLVYIPLTGGPTDIWRPANAKMLTEEVMEIVNFPELKYEDIKTKSLDDITFNKAEIYNYKTPYLIGDKIKTELSEMFDGVTLIVKEGL